MNWRPKDWKKGKNYYSYEEAFVVYEAGADAMLEALQQVYPGLQEYCFLVKEDSNV